VHKRAVKLLTQRKVVRYGLLSLNILLLGGIVFFVLRSSPTSISSYHHAASINADVSSDPLDQLSSADIAVGLARMTSLPEATAVTNQAESVSAQLIVPAQTTVIDKPQIVATTLKSRKDIQSYAVKPGDTIASIAAAFNITSDSLNWSNNLSGNGVAAGTTLVIPPVNGIVYTVKAGDTLDSIAQKYRADKTKLIAYNDAEIAGISNGEQIIIPDAQQPVTRSASSILFGALGGTPSYGSSGSCFYQGHLYPDYLYDCGYCTWWVAHLRAAAGSPVPNLGNASSWGILARGFGMAVGSTPQVGAAVVTSTAGAGHVAYVTAVNGDGTITISEMNHAGFNVVDERTISAGGYIYIY